MHPSHQNIYMIVYWVCTTQYAVSYGLILNTVYTVAFIKPVLWNQQRLAASLTLESVIEMICHVMHGAFMLFIGWRCSAHTQCPAVPRERGQTHPWALRADRTDPRAAVEITVSVNTQQSLCGFKQRGGFYYTSDPWRPSQRDPTQSNTHTLNQCLCGCVCVCVCVWAHARRQKWFNQRVVSPHIHLIKLHSCSSKHPTILFAANKLLAAALVAIVL